MKLWLLTSKGISCQDCGRPKVLVISAETAQLAGEVARRFDPYVFDEGVQYMELVPAGFEAVIAFTDEPEPKS